MFSGIVEAVGQVVAIEDRGEIRSIEIAVPFEGLALGDSIAVDGCCLTCRKIEGNRVIFDLIPETLAKSTLKQLKGGSKVNLERVLTLQKGISGHLVTGHVDATGTVAKMEPIPGGGWFVEVSAPKMVTELLIEKGSVAVDGVSLTVIEAKSDSFSFSLIPHTSTETTLGSKKVGDSVNLESDMFAKMIRKLHHG